VGGTLEEQLPLMYMAKVAPSIVILFGVAVILCWFGSTFNFLPRFG
jgi:low affinity tryptophan permease